MQPARQVSEKGRFPVVYLGDGNTTFEVCRGLCCSMQIHERDAPRFILVGIGYPGDSPMASIRLRARDFTFPGYPEATWKPYCQQAGVLLPDEGTRSYEGAVEFQRFMEFELFPWIDERYGSIPGERTWFGHSAGGSFGLHTLFTRSELYNGYIISSPGLIYDGETPGGFRYEEHDFVLEYARRFVASGAHLRGTNLYLSVGADEEFEPDLAHWRMTRSFNRLVALMKAAAIPGLTLMSEVVPEERHSTVWPIAFVHGIRALFSAASVAGDVRSDRSQ